MAASQAPVSSRGRDRLTSQNKTDPDNQTKVRPRPSQGVGQRRGQLIVSWALGQDARER